VSAKTQDAKYVQGIVPVADAFSATVATDVINMEGYQHCEFIRIAGVGVTGTSTVTVEACDNVTPSNTSAIPFRYRETAAGTDVFGPLTDATSSGFLTTAGSNQIVVIEVDAEALGPSGYQFIRAKFVEGTDSPVLGTVLVRLSGARYGQSADATVIS